MTQELLEVVVPPRSEPDHQTAALGEVCRQSLEHQRTGAGSQEGHHVAGTDDGIEPLADAVITRQVEFGQIADQPHRTGVIGLRGRDQLGVDIDPHDVVTLLEQVPADAAGAASGVEYPGAATDHRVDHAGLAHEVGSFGGHGSEPFDVPLGVIRVRFGDLHPLALVDHVARHPLVLLPARPASDSPRGP